MPIRPYATAQTPPDAVRLDKWLWAARFFRTRALAHAAVKGGKVHLNGQRVKPAARLRAGDRLRISKQQDIYEIDVTGLSEQRGPARDAQRLYAETPAGRAHREEQARLRRAERLTRPQPAKRPDKKQRRQIRRFKEGR